MVDNNLDQGLTAFQKGDKALAVAHFSKYVTENPGSEIGWLWLGHSLDDLDKRKYCYNRVLQINPSNQEAKKSLNSLLNQQFTAPNPPSKKVAPKTIPEKEPIKTNNNKTLVYLIWGIIGFISAAFIIGFSFLIILNNKVSANNIETTPSLIALAVTPSETLTPANTKTPTSSPTITATSDFSVLAGPYIAQAEVQISQKQYAQAIQSLDQAINLNPNSDKAYFLRATSYYKLLENQRSQTEFQDYVDYGLDDIDKAISIEPAIGEYYMLRQDLLIKFVGNLDYRADRFHVNSYAAENALMAWGLGVSTTSTGVDRIYVIDLIYAGKCDEGLEKSQQLIDQTSPQDTTITGLYHIQSNAYICLGEINEAIKMVNKSMVNPLGMEWKKHLLATYLYQAGRNKEALEIINELIEASPNYGGERYYLRAAIEYELGNKEQAEEDLYIGAGNTWFHAGLYSYVLGKLALEDGRTEEGMYLLQNAEATLEVLYNPLREKILKELKTLGIPPLEITPSVFVDVTSIPTIVPRPTSSIKASTPIPGMNYPSGIENAIIFDPKTGAGKIVLKPGDYPLLVFQPSESIKFKNVKKIVFNVASFTETTSPSIQIAIYHPDGAWRIMDNLIWGENEMPNPVGVVYPTGSMVFAIRNYGAENVTIDNLTVTVFLETENGESIKLGPE